MWFIDKSLDHPRADLLVAMVASLLLGVLIPPVADSVLGPQLFTSIATVSSIVLGFSAVVRNRFLEASSVKLAEIYQFYAPTIRRNIKYVMLYCGSVAILALVLFFVPHHYEHIMTGASAGMVILIALSLVRLVILYEAAERGDDIEENSRREYEVNI